MADVQFPGRDVAGEVLQGRGFAGYRGFCEGKDSGGLIDEGFSC